MQVQDDGKNLEKFKLTSIPNFVVSTQYTDRI